MVVLATLLVFFPVWIGSMMISQHVIAAMEREFALFLPGWLKHGYYLVLFGSLLVGSGYASAAWLNKRYPDSRPRSANWEDAG